MDQNTALQSKALDVVTDALLANPKIAANPMAFITASLSAAIAITELSKAGFLTDPDAIATFV